MTSWLRRPIGPGHRLLPALILVCEAGFFGRLSLRPAAVAREPAYEIGTDSFVCSGARSSRQCSRLALLDDGPEDGQPRRYWVWHRIDVLKDLRFSRLLAPGYAVLEHDPAAEEAAWEPGSALLDEPAFIPAGQGVNLRGIGLKPTRLSGDFSAQVTVDLSRSRLPEGRAGPRDAEGDLSFVLVTSWGDQRLFSYWPPSERYAYGALLCTNQVVPLPRRMRALVIQWVRRGKAVSASLLLGGGARRVLDEWSDGSRVWSVSDLEVVAAARRPAGAPWTAAWRGPSRHGYAITKFELLCADPGACRMRLAPGQTVD